MPCWLGCSLFIENALCFTGIEPCSWVTEISLIILELMVFVIEKNTPRHTHFGGNTTAKPYFGPFSCFYFIQPHELPNYARIHCLWLLYEPQNIWGKSQFLGKNDQFCDYPLSDYCLGVLPAIVVPYYTHICVRLGNRGKSTLKLTLMRALFWSSFIFLFQKF